MGTLLLIIACVALTSVVSVLVTEAIMQRKSSEKIRKLLLAFETEREQWDKISGGDMVAAIHMASLGRNFDNLNRRLVKLMEEVGEASEAYLNATSSTNGKGKTFADVREELADCVIVAVDLALTPTPDQEGKTAEEIETAFVNMVGLKLMKWMRYRSAGIVATDAE